MPKTAIKKKTSKTAATAPKTSAAPKTAKAPATTVVAEAAVEITEMAPAAAAGYIVIDYPKNNETLSKGQYAFRIGASPCDKVEISIDDQPWHNCRHAVGYWWHDWNNSAAGSHQVVVRLHKGGKTLVSRRKRFKVA